MVGPSKILTVSYGTFSCTLEGFDDPFSTMRGIAEYFRDLAADDRYFGAEPPTPDAEMLHRIAEREIQRRVESRVDDTGIVLRQTRESIPSTEAAPAPSDAQTAQAQSADAPKADVSPAAPAMAASLAAAATAPQADNQPSKAETPTESVAEKLARIRAAAAKAPDAYQEDEQIDDAFVSSPISAAFDDIEDAETAEDMPEAQEAEATPLQSASSQDSIHDSVEEDETGEETVTDAAEAIDLSHEELETEAESAEEDVIFQPEEMLQDQLEDEDHADADEADVLTLSADDMAEAPIAAIDDGESLEDEAEIVLEADADADVEIEIEIAADAAAEIEIEVEVAAETDAENQEADLEIEAADDEEFDIAGFINASDDEDGQDEGDLAEPQAEAEAETADIEASEFEDEAEVADGAAIARVVKMRRSDFEAAIEQGDLEEIDDAADAEEIEEEAATAQKADVPTLSEDDEADLMATLAEVQRETAAEMRSEKEGRAILEKGDIEGETNSVSRILEVTNSEMEDGEGSRRRSAIAHLKAAVAATRADRLLSRMRKDDEEEEINQYREDLAKVVRPRRPVEGTKPKERRLAPLMLVSEQRVDEPEEAPKPTAEGMVVRPRRVRSDEIDEAADNHDDDADNENIFRDGDSFAEFATEMGAHELPDLLEAAAAYYSFVEGHQHFSRPLIMKAVQSVNPDKEYTREDSLRSFGLLLRNGKIRKVKRGQFQIPPSTRFNPEARAAGE